MSVSVTFGSAHQVLLASEFFMARRPVVDRAQRLIAHELMFCNITHRGSAAVAAAERPTNASVISDVYRHGMDRVLGPLSGILYIDAHALMSDIFQFLPAHKIVLELADMPSAKPEILDRMTELKSAGFHFALVAGDAAHKASELLPLVDGVRIDVTGKERAQLALLRDLYKSSGKKLLAEKVESMEQFRTCFELGFDFFQGYYFTRPDFSSQTGFLPSQAALVDLMALLASDADNAAIEEYVKGNIALALNLLRLMNRPSGGMHPVDSLRQALMTIGRDWLQRWLQQMLDADPPRPCAAPEALLVQAAVRGRLVELLAQKLKPGNRSVADTGFTVGVMSLMDTLFSTPMEKLLLTIPVTDDIRGALLTRQGYFGTLLSLAESTEWKDKNDVQLLGMLSELGLSCDDLYLMQLAAFEWSDQVMRDIG